MEKNIVNFIQINSPDGGFLQSEEWRKFQESVGRKTYVVSGNDFHASIVEHSLPIVGKYFYIPRGPIFNLQFSCLPDRQAIFNYQFSSSNDQILKQIQELINLAKEKNAGWVRIEPATEEILGCIKKNVGIRFIESGAAGFNKLNPYKLKKYKTIKAPHDMQPKEIFIVDISKSEEQLLAEMKAKTRYNIRLAEKRGVIVREISNKKYIDEFLRLTKVMAKRQGIAVHPEDYYRKMLETIPGDILKLYVAEYQGKVIATNLVIFFGDTCTYLHGASDDEYRNVMAPYLLQWRQVLDAKKAGCEKYDFGGINTRYKIQDTRYNSWAGITKFKLGFSPNTAPVTFPGSYDIILNQGKYWGYRMIQKMKSWVK